MEFSGLQKLAMVDYPGKLAATVFTGGCNLRCPFCHNAVLVLHPDQAEHLRQADVLDFLSRRRGLWTESCSPAASRCSTTAPVTFCAGSGIWALL